MKCYRVSEHRIDQSLTRYFIPCVAIGSGPQRGCQLLLFFCLVRDGGGLDVLGVVRPSGDPPLSQALAGMMNFDLRREMPLLASKAGVFPY